MPEYNQVLDKACLDDQPVKRTLVGQCLVNLAREDHQAIGGKVQTIKSNFAVEIVNVVLVCNALISPFLYN